MKNILYDNYHGILLENSADDATVAKNEIMNNRWNGITLTFGCSGAVVIENTISDNFYAGVGISGASYNYIYHNTFKTNRYQAYDDATNVWDNGFPSGGNCWYDYTGSDADGDGIGDTPYAIPGGINIDRYPLMDSYTDIDTIPPAVKIVSPENGLYLRNLRLLSWLFRQRTIIIGDITIDVEASDVQSGIVRVEFYIDNDDEVAFNDTLAPYSWTWKQKSLLRHAHTILVVAYDNAGNANADMLDVKRYF